MTTPDVEATRRRATLRGAEAIARWRMRTGAWAARVYAVFAAVPALIALFWGGEMIISITVISIVFALIAVFISFRIARGSLRAAIAMLAIFVAERGLSYAASGWHGLYQGVIVTAVVAFGLVQGVWGAATLQSIERERAAESVPVRAP